MIYNVIKGSKLKCNHEPQASVSLQSFEHSDSVILYFVLYQNSEYF